MSEKILESLNASQRAAVSSASQTLAILAGPGSGKTHTLTSRTAWLLKHEGYQPWNIIVATFTVKAATEMKERIGKLIGDGMESKLVLGTFHSIARRYLTRYGHLINIPKGFGIADSNDSLGIIKRIVKRHSLMLDPSAARSRISSQKAKGFEPDVVFKSKSVEAQEFQTCYTEYEESLKRSNLLDYDDLLLRCADLLRSHPSCVSNVEAVLIDEFQDTNIVQFDLMRLFAAQRKRVTIVGDPDQSIYGFRSAETKNFKRMLRQYPDTVTIPLEENYRSSGAILLASLEVIRQDASRIDKSLLATHTVGTQPVLRKLPSAQVEAQWIVGEIRRCLVLTGNLMDYDDISILLRSASLSRVIESALGKAGIPYRMVGGLKFYDRFEIRLILDYLRVINQPENNDALARVLNVPSRKIGDTTLKALLEEADTTRKTLWALSLDIVQGNIMPKTKLSKQTEQGLSSFINLILRARTKASNELQSPMDLMEWVSKKICLNEYLEKIYPDKEDHENRLANVQELLALASEFSIREANGADDDALPKIHGLVQDEVSEPLSKFLGNVALVSAVDVKGAEKDSEPKAQVTISTIHAAKGLEWPIVFIPAAYQGSIPHSRAEDDDEERRLLYVAMTRAKAMLNVSWPVKSSKGEQAVLSPFLTSNKLKPYFTRKGPSIGSTVVQDLAAMLRRAQPQLNIQAVADLEHMEDERYNDEDENSDSRRNESWEGHHYSMGQQVPKRRRVDDANIHLSSATRWEPDYTTTVGQLAALPSARLPSAGFTSAGSHFQTLQNQPVSDLSQRPKTPLVQGPTHPKTKSTARTTKRPADQGSMLSFLKTGNMASQKVAGSEPPTVHVPQFSATDSLTSTSQFNHSSYSQRNSTSRPNSVLSQQDSFGILPSLASHKLGSSSLSRPLPTKRWQQEDETIHEKKPYIFLSSSPQTSENLIAEAKEENIRPQRPDQISNHIPLQVSSRPAVTFHATTVRKLNTLGALPPPNRKTLGVRRTMNGWNDRKNK